MKARRYRAVTSGDIVPGAEFAMPDHTGVGYDRQIVSVGPKTTKVARVYDSGQSWPYKVPTESVPQHINDLRRVLPKMRKSGDAAIDAVIAGKGRYIGKGNDGIVYGVNGEAVKVSTTTPYVPENPGHRTLKGAIAHLKAEHDAHRTLKAAGVPGVPEVRGKTHGGRYWLVKPFLRVLDLDEKGSITRAELDALDKALSEMHTAGLTLNDEIQVGQDKAGRFWFIDLGQVRPWSQHRAEDDVGRMRRVYQAQGWKRIPTGAELVKKEQYARARMERLVPKLLARGDVRRAVSVTQDWIQYAEPLAHEHLSGPVGTDAEEDAAVDAYSAEMDAIDAAKARVGLS